MQEPSAPQSITRRRQLRILLANALTRPMAAAVLAITVVVGLTVSYWFLPVGALFYALIVYNTLQDPEESRRVLNAALYPARPRNIQPGRLSGPYRAAIQRALDTRKRIESAVAQTDDPAIRKALGEAIGDIQELVSTIYDIALKAQSLQASLSASNISPSALINDIERLEQLARTTDDEFARQQYGAALDGKRQQLQNYRDAVAALDRWHAQLDNALSTLDTIYSQVLRIRSAEVLSLTSATDELSHSLKQEVEELKATSDALDIVYRLSK